MEGFACVQAKVREILKLPSISIHQRAFELLYRQSLLSLQVQLALIELPVWLKNRRHQVDPKIILFNSRTCYESF